MSVWKLQLVKHISYNAAHTVTKKNAHRIVSPLCCSSHLSETEMREFQVIAHTPVFSDIGKTLW